MKENKYRFFSKDRTYTGYGYTKTRCEAILDMLESGFFDGIDRVEIWSDSLGKWVAIENSKI